MQAWLLGSLLAGMKNSVSHRDFSPGSAVFSHFDPSGCVVADEDSPVFHAYDDAPEDPADDPYVLAFADLAASIYFAKLTNEGEQSELALTGDEIKARFSLVNQAWNN